MISDSELVERLREFLKSSDLNTTTTAIVRRRLEEDFGVDLSEKKAFIREQVDLFLQSQLENVKEEEEEEDENGERNEEEEEEEEEDGRRKGLSMGITIRMIIHAGAFQRRILLAFALNSIALILRIQWRVYVSSVVWFSIAAQNEHENSTQLPNAFSYKYLLLSNIRNNHNKENKKKGGGFTKLCSLSPQLQEFVGVSELPRTEELLGDLSYLCIKLNLNTPCESFSPDESSQKESTERGKRQKGGGSGFLAPLQLSDALVKFIGTGESALSRAEVTKRMWEYIKQNNLQDPSNKKMVKCDEKLKELFDVDSFTGFTVSKLLSAHFIKAVQ
ncbi:hypothetical protein ACLOJK_038721 [Asimina triloba]